MPTIVVIEVAAEIEWLEWIAVVDAPAEAEELAGTPLVDAPAEAEELAGTPLDDAPAEAEELAGTPLDDAPAELESAPRLELIDAPEAEYEVHVNASNVIVRGGRLSHWYIYSITPWDAAGEREAIDAEPLLEPADKLAPVVVKP